MMRYPNVFLAPCLFAVTIGCQLQPSVNRKTFLGTPVSIQEDLSIQVESVPFYDNFPSISIQNSVFAPLFVSLLIPKSIPLCQNRSHKRDRINLSFIFIISKGHDLALLSSPRCIFISQFTSRGSSVSMSHVNGSRR